MPKYSGGRSSGPGAEAIKRQDCKLQTGIPEASKLRALDFTRKGDLGVGQGREVRNVKGGGGPGGK